MWECSLLRLCVPVHEYVHEHVHVCDMPVWMNAWTRVGARRKARWDRHSDSQ